MIERKMGENRFILKTSGFALYFFLSIMALFFFALYLVTKDMLQYGISLAGIFGFILFCWLGIFIYKFITGQKIEINDELLTAQFSLPTDISLFPRIRKYQIRLKNIRSVTIARRKYFEEHSKDFQDEGLKNVINTYRNLFSVSVSRGIAIPIPLGFATRYTPLMYIAPKDKSQRGITVTTKPFSKNGFRKLIQELRKRNISVTTEPALGV